MGETFLKIDNNFFSTESNIFSLAGTEGFTLYCYLLCRQANSPTAYIRIKDIQMCLSRNYDKRPSIIYSENKNNKIGCLKDKKTIAKYLKTLVRLNLVQIINLEEIAEKRNISIENMSYELINITETLIIKCTKQECKNGWFGISVYLFEDYIHKIGHIGWSILCLLSKLHNKSFGNTECEGFANPSEDYISSILDRNRTTIGAYLHLLEEKKLIKIEKQEPIIKINKYGVEELTYTPNHYIVKHKVQENKYYIKSIEETNKNGS